MFDVECVLKCLMWMVARGFKRLFLPFGEGSHLLMPSVCLFAIEVVCLFNMTGSRTHDHYNSDEHISGNILTKKGLVIDQKDGW